MLDGIDIASYQSSLKPAAMSTTDFVIVKATGGKGYRNPSFGAHADATLKAGKLPGCYHYAREIGCEGTAQQEADFFASAVAPYVGKATLWLDWEAGAIALGPKWAKAWLDRVYAKTGVKPGIYMSKGVANQYDWSAVSKAGYVLWVAQYPDYSPTGYQRDPWTDPSPFGAWGKPTIFQYTSCGRIAGYTGDLDLDLFYGNRAKWLSLEAVAGKAAQAAAAVKSAVSNASSASRADVVSRAKVAVAIHRDMVEDDDNGYSWKPRWGEDGKGMKTVTVDGHSYQYDRGSYDCSSSSITAWREALRGTAYEHALDAAETTRNMREVFVGSGLFSWKPMSFIASPGDLYLDEDRHVSMCQSQVPDLMSEFSINEHGGTHGGKVGDQTGREAAVNPYREEWDGILHYNGKADVAPAKETAGTLYRVTASRAKVRTKRTTSKGSIVGEMAKGKTVRLTAVKENKYGNVWGKVASGPFKGRFMAVRYDGRARIVKAGAKSVDEIAREVLAGKWGNGQARVDALTKKGYDPHAVQKRVNELSG